MSKLNVKVKILTHERSVIEVETRGGSKEIFIDKTNFGHAWDDFAEFDISDENYYDLENL
ncbi:hypothetical protein [Oceanobacillus sp. FSL H7-0719]|uniref:hypothetical protein n=1 Tax=Oceanobacillus sp. FSL H7-0719 TaxID=2954507 RepID=UPI003244BB4C